MSALNSVKRWLAQLKPNTSGQQLLAVHNGYCLWLGLIGFEGEEPQLLATGTSTAIDAVTAIGEARQQLSQQSSASLPRQLAFISTCALPALLDLPIEADKPRKTTEMESMISWELETQIADNNDLYALGAILVGRGLLTQSQRHETAVELEMRRVNGSGLARYGEVAIDLGLITNDQLQDSLLLQEKLAVTDAQLACGWQLQTLVSEDKTEHLWLAAGIDTRVRRQWYTGFAQNGLKLTGIVPLLGSMAPHAAKHSENGNVVVVEAHHDSVSTYRLEKSQLASFHQQPRQHNQSLAEQCYGIVVEQLRSDTEAVLLIDVTRTIDAAEAKETNSDSDIEELRSRLQREVQWLIPTDACCTLDQKKIVPDGVIAAFFGVATTTHKHALFAPEKKPVQLAQIPPREPPPPIWKNIELYRYGIPALLLLTVFVHGSYSVMQQRQLQQQLDTLDKKYKEQAQLNKQLNSISGAYKKTSDKLADLTAQATDAKNNLERLNNNVVRRTRLVPRLLRAISQSVTDRIMLDGIVEPRQKGKNSFNITAWAMDNASAAQFTERLQQLVSRLEYRVADPDIRSGIGRYGLNGYTIDLWIIPVNNDTDNKNSRGKKEA
ncbi:hypothetical protein A9Q99_05280 [Gammaproteobacteria bacterium 45_16_T64]|nr:hypothetical protein A9Q99_05280 [Gammaproteobacteria bacterium 45_16_T64]